MAARDKIGYGNPPKHTQFKKGCSGNPSGRPKGSKGVIALQEKIFGERMFVTENGRRMKITKIELFFRQLWKMAVTGDIRAMKMVFETIRGTAERESKIIEQESRPLEEMTDEELMAMFRRYHPSSDE